jgi:hypothetical protein
LKKVKVGTANSFGRRNANGAVYIYRYMGHQKVLSEKRETLKRKVNPLFILHMIVPKKKK